MKQVEEPKVKYATVKEIIRSSTPVGTNIKIKKVSKEVNERTGFRDG